jgi:hypothetical protein
MKQNISKHFYDKTLTEYSEEDTIDNEGFVTGEATSTENTFLGNVGFENLEQAREDYGIEERIDIKISTQEDKSLGSILGYDGVLYKIVKRIPSDSHNLLFGKKWS